MPKFSKKELANHLQVVGKAVPTRSVIEHIQGILLQGDGEVITMTATNLEIAITSTIEMPHFEEFGVVLPAKVAEIIAKLPAEHVEFFIDDAFNTTIKSGNSKFVIQGLAPEGFSRLPELKEVFHSFTTNSTALKNALSKTLFAVAPDDHGKPAFTGVNFEFIGDGSMRLCTSDTFRLSIANLPVKTSVKGEQPFLIPASALVHVAKTLPAGEEVQVSVAENHAFFTCKHLSISTRLLSEPFPNIERVIPTAFETTITLKASEFSEAVERVRLVDEAKVSAATNLKVEEGSIMLFSQSKIGTAGEQLKCDIDGKPIEVAVSARFLSEMLKTTLGDTCSVKFSGINKPVILTDSADPEYLYLVLPIKA